MVGAVLFPISSFDVDFCIVMVSFFARGEIFVDEVCFLVLSGGTTVIVVAQNDTLWMMRC